MDGYPINPVVSGLSRAVQAAQAIQGMALQREAIERAIAREQREQALQEFDIEQRMLTGGAKPVEAGGTYEQTIRTPEGGFMQTRPPVDRRRTIRTPGGREYYMPTAQERRSEELASKLEEIRSLGDIETQLAVGRARALLPVQREAAQVDVPGFGTVHQAAIPVLTGREATAAAAARQQGQQTFQAGQAQKTREMQERIARIRLERPQATAAALNAIENRKRARLYSVERWFRAALDKVPAEISDEARAQAGLPTRTGLLEQLREAKQAAQDAYESELEQYGLPTQHYEYPAEGMSASLTRAVEPVPAKPKPGRAADLIAEVDAQKRRAQKR
ncbi:MAG: hypothetical protein FJW34_04570 [Acidobacteria bacterium]|nr:hypothetical protein [Acidobacteriota bacterium]